jgi:transcriptional regulator GlxA family with amidase domain
MGHFREMDLAMPVRLRVGFLLARRFTLTAFSSFVDTLRLAADEGDRSRQILCSWKVMAADGRPVTASCGVALVPESPLLDPASFDYIVVVGGLLRAGPAIDPATAAYLQRAAAAGVTLVGVCTGSFILTRLGLLQGRRVCVSWFHRHDFVDEFPGVDLVSDQLFLIDGDRVTCSGGAGVIDLAAALVRRHVGEAAAGKALNVLQLDGPRGETSVQPAPELARAARDARVRRVALAMEQNLGHPLPVADLARRVGLGPRQLDRLFRAELGAGPATIYRGMRLDYGRWLLERSDRSVAEIAALAGFVDGAHFSRAFKRWTGLSPSALRAARSTPDQPGAPDDMSQGRRFE